MKLLWLLQVILVYRGLQDTYIGQVTIKLRIVQAIANHKLIWDLKSSVIEMDRFDTLALFV